MYFMHFKLVFKLDMRLSLTHSYLPLHRLLLVEMLTHAPYLSLFIYLFPHLFFSSVHCVKIFNIRPYGYFGSVVQGKAMGYLLPQQENFSGITSHLELQMCDGSDPSPFIWDTFIEDYTSHHKCFH